MQIEGFGEKEPGEKEQGGVFEGSVHVITLPNQLTPKQIKIF